MDAKNHIQLDTLKRIVIALKTPIGSVLYFPMNGKFAKTSYKFGDRITIIRTKKPIYMNRTLKSSRVDRIQVISVFVTDECNQSCKHCYLNLIKSDSTRYVDTDVGSLYRRYSEILNQQNFEPALHLTGGEPTLRMDFLNEVIPEFKKIIINTNGKLIENILELSKYKNVAFQISFDYVDSKDMHNNTEEILYLTHRIKNKISISSTIRLDKIDELMRFRIDHRFQQLWTIRHKFLFLRPETQFMISWNKIIEELDYLENKQVTDANSFLNISLHSNRFLSLIEYGTSNIYCHNHIFLSTNGLVTDCVISSAEISMTNRTSCVDSILFNKNHPIILPYEVPYRLKECLDCWCYWICDHICRYTIQRRSYLCKSYHKMILGALSYTLNSNYIQSIINKLPELRLPKAFEVLELSVLDSIVPDHRIDYHNSLQKDISLWTV